MLTVACAGRGDEERISLDGAGRHVTMVSEIKSTLSSPDWLHYNEYVLARRRMDRFYTYCCTADPSGIRIRGCVRMSNLEPSPKTVELKMSEKLSLRFLVLTRNLRRIVCNKIPQVD